MKPEKVNLRLKRANLRPERAELSPKSGIFRSGRDDLWLERVDSGLRGLILGLGGLI